MQIEKLQPEGKRIVPETRFTVFPALSVDPRVGIYRSASETDGRLYFYFFYIGDNCSNYKVLFTIRHFFYF